MKKIIILNIIILFLYACGASSNTANKQKDSKENLAKQKFGIEVADLSDDHKKQSGLSHGVLIMSVYSFYPANKAGIKKGDIITSLDKHPIISVENFDEILKSYKYIYGQVTVGVIRDNQLQKVHVYLN